MKTIIFIATILYISFINIAVAHGGKTDAKGCHTDKKTQTHHCHP